MTAHIERLIQQLDDSTGPSYDAGAELIGIGTDAIPATIDSLPGRPHEGAPLEGHEPGPDLWVSDA